MKPVIPVVLVFLLQTVQPLWGESVKPFSFADVDVLAQKAATSSDSEIQEPLPEALDKLDYDEYRKLRWKGASTIWRDEALPFQLQFFHRGHLFQDRVDMHAITPTGLESLTYHSQYFTLEELKLPAYEDIGYAGLRICYPLNQPEVMDELAVFLGKSYFRAVAQHLQYGLSARGLAINTATEGVAEEFPLFKRFWIQKPEKNNASLRIFALLDSKSVTGAYQLDLSPGRETVMSIRSKLYVKESVRRFGVAPLTSMFWYGENSPEANRDWRPEVHDSDGLQIQKQSGEWLWRPLTFGRTIRENRFLEPGLKGFGLAQRDRSFEHYQDKEAHYDQRPSAWVELKKGFEKGAVELVQLPTGNEYQDNMVAFWSPESLPKKGDVLEYEYQIIWHGGERVPSTIGKVVQTVVIPEKNEVKYQIDFSGDVTQAGTQVPKAVIITNPILPVSEISVINDLKSHHWRLQFTLKNPPENKKSIDLSVLLANENKPVTETWVYSWIP